MSSGSSPATAKSWSSTAAASLSRSSRAATTISRRELLSGSPEETEQAGARLATHLRPGDLVLLTGELGSGKTTLVKGIARGLQVSGDVLSPTFQLVRVHAGEPVLAHVDAYRLEPGARIDPLGLHELLDEGLVIVEWGNRLRERLAGLAPARQGEVLLTHVDEGHRRLRIVAGPAEWSF